MDFILANALHYLGFAAMFAALVLQLNFFQSSVDGAVARKLARTDAVYGLSALVVLVTGLLRVFLFEKPPSYYGHNYLFHIKVTVFLVAALLSIYPTVRFLRHKQAQDGEKVEYPRAIGVLLKWELALLVSIPFLAVMMAHGYGMTG
nr:DUF2214 family protein [Candidatus Krumholzibacteria bacterium]